MSHGDFVSEIEHLFPPPIAKVICDYSYIDMNIAARVLAKHNPVYMVIPNDHKYYAYVSIKDSCTSSCIDVRIDHESDFIMFGSPVYTSTYESLTMLDASLTRPVDASLTRPVDDAECKQFVISRRMKNHTVIEPRHLDSIGKTIETTLGKCLTRELGKDDDCAPKLFRMIKQDLQTIIDGNILYAPPHIPIDWPPKYSDLRKVFPKKINVSKI